MHASFFYITCLQHIKMDHDLLMTLIERKRRETHTFHPRVGETTLTLQDIAILLGLPTNKQAHTVIGI